MASLNRVMLIGNLGKDPEVRYTAAGTAVASFSLATSERFKGKSGEYEERTEWHNVTLWARTAEIAGEFLSKGKTVYIEGRLATRKWQDKEGKDRYTTEIIGEVMKMLSGKGEGAPAGNQQRSSGANNQQRSSGVNNQSQGSQYEGPAFDDDTIPF